MRYSSDFMKLKEKLVQKNNILNLKNLFICQLLKFIGRRNNIILPIDG